MRSFLGLKKLFDSFLVTSPTFYPLYMVVCCFFDLRLKNSYAWTTTAIMTTQPSTMTANSSNSTIFSNSVTLASLVDTKFYSRLFSNMRRLSSYSCCWCMELFSSWWASDWSSNWLFK